MSGDALDRTAEAVRRIKYDEPDIRGQNSIGNEGYL